MQMPDSVPDFPQFAAFLCSSVRELRLASEWFSACCTVLQPCAVILGGLKGRCSATELRPSLILNILHESDLSHMDRSDCFQFTLWQALVLGEATDQTISV